VESTGGGWYDLVQGDRLEQGDLLFHCPLPLLLSATETLEEEAELLVDIEYHDVVVLTQSCDLANDKVQHVVLCPHFDVKSISEINPDLARKGQLDSVRKGAQYRYLLLNDCPDATPPLGIRIVDFGRPFSLPKAFLQSLASSQPGRPRLRSPYREHLSQGFARFFMRVGLPQDVTLP